MDGYDFTTVHWYVYLSEWWTRVGGHDRHAGRFGGLFLKFNNDVLEYLCLIWVIGKTDIQTTVEVKTS